MGTGIVSGILTLITGWVVAILLTYPIVRAISPKHAGTALLLVIVGPPIIVALVVVLGGAAGKRRGDLLVQKQDEEKFKEYIAVCHQTDTKIIERITADHPRGVVLTDKGLVFRTPSDDDELGRCLFGSGSSSVCVASKIDFFEVPVPGKNLWDKYSANKEPIKFDTQNPVLYTRDRMAASSAKYGLILESPEDPATVVTQAGYKLQRSKISLARLADGKLMAHTSIYFKDSKSGEFGCPDFYTETAKMLKAAFK